jgi:hypothetical protein
MQASLSPENVISNGLRGFGCSGRSFVALAKSLGVAISDGPFSEQLKTSFDQKTADKLLAVLERMRDLTEAVGLASNNTSINIDWTQTVTISTALAVRQLAVIAAEQKADDRGAFAEFASATTKFVAAQ